MALVVRPTFQDPSYQTRQSFNTVLNAGSGQTSTVKFVAHAALTIFSLSTFMATAGTSTYTNTVTGVGTSIINADTAAVIVITNANAFSTSSASLSTATYGPFVVGGNFSSGNGTQTAQVGGLNQYAINTTTGTQGYGGIPVSQGGYMYVVSGTDATATYVAEIDYQITPGAGLSQ